MLNERSAEHRVLEFLEMLGMPGVRICEGDRVICDQLGDMGFTKTPDLICGPSDLRTAPLAGLFMIDVTEPSCDMMYKEAAWRNLNGNLPRQFKEGLFSAPGKEFNLDSLPTAHHRKYLEVIQNKIDKYSGLQRLCSNTAVVVHFNIGNLNSEETERYDVLLCLEEYILRFIPRIKHQESKITDRELPLFFVKRLFSFDKNPNFYVVSLSRLTNIRMLFVLIHVLFYRNGRKCSAAFFIVNTDDIDRGADTHPIRKWLKRIMSRIEGIKSTEHREFTIENIRSKNPLPFR